MGIIGGRETIDWRPCHCQGATADEAKAVEERWRKRKKKEGRMAEISSLAARHPDPHFSLEVPLPKGEDTGETRGSGEEGYDGSMNR